MGIFDNFFGKKENWNEIRETDEVYIKDSAISILMLQTESGENGTGWVDKGYENYKFKKYCPYNFLIMVDFTDEIADKNPDLDMGTVEDFFVEELRKIGIAHIVARVVTDKGMNIEMYIEKMEDSMKRLKEISEDKNRLVSFSCEVNKDPKWEAVSGLMNL